VAPGKSQTLETAQGLGVLKKGYASKDICTALNVNRLPEEIQHYPVSCS
jgi:hypothetical protein